MRISQFEIIPENIHQDDYELISSFNLLKDEIALKKKSFDALRQRGHENDYLSLVVARLAYEYAKEEYDILLNEIIKRGLITV